MELLKNMTPRETISSRLIAEETGKRHNNVIRDIRNLIEKGAIDFIDSQNSNLSFDTQEPVCIESVYTSGTGKEYSEYLLNEDAASVLATSYDPVIARKLIKLIKELRKAVDKPKSTLEILELSIKQLIETERRMNEHDERLAQLENSRKENLKALSELPLSEEAVPELAVKDKVRMLVNRYAGACGLSQQEVWNRLYSELYYKYHIHLKASKKIKKSESWLDVAERKGHLDKLYRLISGFLKAKGIDSLNLEHA